MPAQLAPTAAQLISLMGSAFSPGDRDGKLEFDREADLFDRISKYYLFSSMNSLRYLWSKDFKVF
jgi:hypothetical protein